MTTGPAASRNNRPRRPGLVALLTVLALLLTSTGASARDASIQRSSLLGGLLRGLVGGTVEVVVDLADLTIAKLGLVLDPVTGWLFDPTQANDLGHVRQVIDADRVHGRGFTGTGVGVAVIDTGGLPVEGLTSGNVANGPDLSFESQSDELRYLDTFGHGTHIAGIIGGRDASGGGFRGVAPDADVVTLKLASFDGAVDVSQVVAAIDWVVEHRDDEGRRIRVINLSYGTDGTQDHRLDPLAHAVQNAWRHGIVVVVAAGNDGENRAKMNNPAYDPYVIAVGAADTRGTVTTSDDVVPTFSSPGDAARRPDLVAPGQSIVSLRAPGSYVDEHNPVARVGDRYFRGSGTSQAAAVVSGAAALLLEQRPSLTPDQVKALLTSTATPLPKADPHRVGAGMVNVDAAARATPPRAQQGWPASTGLGSIEQARGSFHVADDGVELTGERHILGPWDAATWAPASTRAQAWSDGYWHGAEWTGDCWCADTWSGRTWAGRTWAGRTWAGRTWAGESWSGRTWAGRTWAGEGWSGRTWAGDGWSGRTWAGAS